MHTQHGNLSMQQLLRDTTEYDSIRFQIQKKLNMCHNIISIYCTGILKNTNFHLHIHPSKKKY